MKCNLGVNLQLSNYKDLDRYCVAKFKVTFNLLATRNRAAVGLFYVRVYVLNTDIFDNKRHAT